MLQLNFQKLERISFLLITILGVVNGQVTVFYIVYLFWFQELLRTLVDFFIILRQRKTWSERWLAAKQSFGGFLLLMGYAVFIIVLFGLMLNWDSQELLGQNIIVFFLRNWYFNFSAIIFILEYIFYRLHTDNTELQILPFNKRQIILHISIILGAVIHFLIIPRFQIQSNWGMGLIILPFLLLKLFLDKREESTLPIKPESGI